MCGSTSILRAKTFVASEGSTMDENGVSWESQKHSSN
jgi:hypothetical protein